MHPVFRNPVHPTVIRLFWFLRLFWSTSFLLSLRPSFRSLPCPPRSWSPSKRTPSISGDDHAQDRTIGRHAVGPRAAGAGPDAGQRRAARAADAPPRTGEERIAPVGYAGSVPLAGLLAPARRGDWSMALACLLLPLLGQALLAPQANRRHLRRLVARLPARRAWSRAASVMWNGRWACRSRATAVVERTSRASSRTPAWPDPAAGVSGCGSFRAAVFTRSGPWSCRSLRASGREAPPPCRSSARGQAQVGARDADAVHRPRPPPGSERSPSFCPTVTAARPTARRESPTGSWSARSCSRSAAARPAP